VFHISIKGFESLRGLSSKKACDGTEFWLLNWGYGGWLIRLCWGAPQDILCMKIWKTEGQMMTY